MIARRKTQVYLLNIIWMGATNVSEQMQGFWEDELRAYHAQKY